jgi:hypothetical protein
MLVPKDPYANQHPRDPNGERKAACPHGPASKTITPAVLTNIPTICRKVGFSPNNHASRAILSRVRLSVIVISRAVNARKACL